jgi:hypothetical protein
MVSVAGPVAADGFTGPVFGLATAPNGDILAADAAVGVVVFRDGEVHLNAALPGVSDVGAIGRGSWWAIRGAADGGQDEDGGQGVYRVSRGKARMLAKLFEFEVQQSARPPTRPIQRSAPNLTAERTRRMRWQRPAVR